MRQLTLVRIFLLFTLFYGGAARTIQGIETVNMIRKGQVRWLSKDDIAGQVAFVARLFGLTAVA